MTDRITQDYFRTLLLLLEYGRVEDVKECLRMSLLDDRQTEYETEIHIAEQYMN
jgi:hypothetical protein